MSQVPSTAGRLQAVKNSRRPSRTSDVMPSLSPVLKLSARPPLFHCPSSRLLVKRFAFDLEALANANRLGYRIAEAPVVVTRERDFPRVGTGDAFDVLWDTAAVWYRMYLRRWYDRVGVNADARAAAGDVALAPEGIPSIAPPRGPQPHHPSAGTPAEERSPG